MLNGASGFGQNQSRTHFHYTLLMCMTINMMTGQMHTLVFAHIFPTETAEIFKYFFSPTRWQREHSYLHTVTYAFDPVYRMDQRWNTLYLTPLNTVIQHKWPLIFFISKCILWQSKTKRTHLPSFEISSNILLFMRNKIVKVN